MRFIYIVLFGVIIQNTFSQTTISVKQSDYKNETILFYTYSDYVTFLKDTVALVSTNEEGAFSTEISFATTRQVFLDLGVYHCSFYIEQGKKYVLDLPERREKTKADKLNIYFEPIEMRLALKNTPPKDLNKLIASFDGIYDEFLSQNFDTIYRFPQSKMVEKFENDINNFYSEIQHPYFKEYKNYRITELKFLGPNRSYKTISFNYYNNKKILYYNPTYMHLFNQMFKDFFVIYANTPEGQQLENVVQEGRSIKKLVEILDKSVAFSDSTFEELIALKGIHDELFNPRTYNQIHFPRPQIRIILDSIAEFSVVPEHRLIAKNIISKANIDSKIQGKQVPDFKLLSIDGSIKSLADFKGRYIYLNFMRTDVVPAMESMDRMINFYKNHKDDIEIISIFTDENSADFFKLDTSKYNWTLLYIDESRAMLDFYKQITWPQFYLISPEGKILAAPAPSIKEGFEVKFFELIDAYHLN